MYVGRGADRYLKRLVAKHQPTPLTNGNPMVLNGYALISNENSLIWARKPMDFTRKSIEFWQGNPFNLDRKPKYFTRKSFERKSIEFG